MREGQDMNQIHNKYTWPCGSEGINHDGNITNLIKSLLCGNLLAIITLLQEIKCGFTDNLPVLFDGKFFGYFSI